jgi:RNA polymerase sigma-70 factor (ECF subfamily)
VEALVEERRQALLAAVNGLRDEDRLVVAYRYFLELSETDMADALGCARGTVKSRLSRALGRLRQVVTAAGLKDLDRQEATHG